MNIAMIRSPIKSVDRDVSTVCVGCAERRDNWLMSDVIKGGRVVDGVGVNLTVTLGNAKR